MSSVEVLAGSSRVFFKGAVAVPPGSDNTTANQLCRTLQLSNDSRVGSCGLVFFFGGDRRKQYIFCNAFRQNYWCLFRCFEVHIQQFHSLLVKETFVA